MSLDEVNGAVLEESGPSEPSPSPHLRPNRGLRDLFFSGSQEPEEMALGAIDEALSVGEAMGLHGPSDSGSASAGDWPSDESGDPESATTSSRASSAEGGPLKPLGKAALRATTAKAVLIGSAMAHRVAARTEGQQAVGLYLADEQDAENIGAPIAEIMHRHGGVAGKAMNPDTNDALQAIMGLANYVSKQVIKATQAREVDQHLSAGGTLPTPGEAA